MIVMRDGMRARPTSDIRAQYVQQLRISSMEERAPAASRVTRVSRRLPAGYLHTNTHRAELGI